MHFLDVQKCIHEEKSLVNSQVLLQISAISSIKSLDWGAIAVYFCWKASALAHSTCQYNRLFSNLQNASANISNVHVMWIVLPRNKLALIFIPCSECVMHARGRRRCLELIGIQSTVKVNPGGRVRTLAPGQLTSHMRWIIQGLYTCLLKLFVFLVGHRLTSVYTPQSVDAIRKRNESSD